MIFSLIQPATVTRNSPARRRRFPPSSFILPTFPAAASKNTDSRKKEGRKIQEVKGKSMQTEHPNASRRPLLQALSSF
jgi:hypothetical protein